ncbi:MAG: hypothetical protein LBD82_04630 [Deltaproteobacteria bacterium]|jgi:cell division protein FtsI (penicillin-binding protein 3)|nr:hypothetical protein [Deltaproteobacteria bacterium]
MKAMPSSNRARGRAAARKGNEPVRGAIPMLAVAFLLALFMGYIWSNFYDLQINHGTDFAARAARQHLIPEKHTGRRGSILDRHGAALASSIESYSLAVRPPQIKDMPLTVSFLSSVMDVPQDKIISQLQSSKKYLVLRRNLSEIQARDIREAGLAGLELYNEQSRIYKNSHQAAQLLGFTGQDSIGLEGLERSFESRLAGRSTFFQAQRSASGTRMYMEDGMLSNLKMLNGRDLQLTIDSTIQHYTEKTLAAAVRENAAQWGGALVVHAAGGEILAWAQAPLINPNLYSQYPPEHRRNRLAMDALEFGSTIKPFVVAAALEEGKITPDTLFDTENGKWTLRGKTFTDTRPKKLLSVTDGMKYSSNIVMGKIAMLLGAKKYQNYLYRLGFGQKSSLPLTGENPGILRQAVKWGEVDLAAAGFGQGFSSTLIQMAQAYLCLINGGIKKPLRLILDAPPAQDEERIFSPDTAARVMRMLEAVVNDEDGGGRAARIPWLKVLGKTGTAEVAEQGVYGEKRIASFVGVAPADKPELLVLVVIVDPRNNKYGATAAAPIFKQVLTDALASLGRLPDADPKAATALEDEAERFQPAAYTQRMAREDALKRSGLAGASVTGSAGPAERGRGLPSFHKVPDLRGLALHEAAAVLAAGNIIPLVRGQGARVARQSPPPGADWPLGSFPPLREPLPGDNAFVIWLEDKS